MGEPTYQELEALVITYATCSGLTENQEQIVKHLLNEEIESYICKTCGKTVTENDVKDFETAKQMGYCGPCYYAPANWGNE